MILERYKKIFLNVNQFKVTILIQNYHRHICTIECITAFLITYPALDTQLCF